MGLSPVHIVILAVIAVLLFGGGRFSSIMVDVAKGVKGFKRSMAEPDDEVAGPAARLPSAAVHPVAERDRRAAVPDRPGA